MKHLPLRRRSRDGAIVAFTWVDDEDFARPEIGRKTWRLQGGYAVRFKGTAPNRTCVHLHRVVLGATSGVDHKDGNTLNNTRKNLRLATQAQNLQNQKLRKDNTSGHRGVCWRKQTQKWEAKIWLGGRTFYLGRFANLDDAVKAYDRAALKLHPFSTRRDKAS